MLCRFVELLLQEQPKLVPVQRHPLGYSAPPPSRSSGVRVRDGGLPLADFAIEFIDLGQGTYPAQA